jgi:hypothetical protein
MNDEHEIFVNRSVSLGDIDEDEEPQTIREIIRDKYLRDTTVLILLVGTETKIENMWTEVFQHER